MDNSFEKSRVLVVENSYEAMQPARSMLDRMGTTGAVSVVRDAGATSYILKPFSAQQLENEVRMVARLIAVCASRCERIRVEHNERNFPDRKLDRPEPCAKVER